MNTYRSAVKFAVFGLVLVSLMAILTPLLPRAYADVTGSGTSSVLVAKAAAANTLYLPVLERVGSAPGVTPTATTTPGGGGSSTGNFFLPWQINGSGTATNGPSVAVDAHGGVHVAYHAYTTDGSGKRPVYYVYCASNCSNPASFSAPVSLGDKVDHVNLALDSSGDPRILWVGSDLTSDPAIKKLDAYYYAVCDSGCTNTNAAGWTIARIFGTDSGLAHNSRMFALDPQGRPRFIFYEDWCPTNNCVVDKGTFLIFCNSGCTTPANWSRTKITGEEFDLASLAMTSTGQPRFAASYLDMSVDPAVRYAIYVECNTDCTTWTIGGAFDIFTAILADIQGGYFRLALDSSDRPRLALYTGAVPTGSTLEANKLYYLFCNAACSDVNSSTNGWDGYSLGLPAGVGTYVDLAIGPQGRPRLAYEDVTRGLIYRWCTANCESASPAWQEKLVDSSNVLDATEPVPPLPSCQVASWFAGKRASLAFDASGNPRIATDAEHWQGIDPITNPPGSPGCPTVKMDQINARISVLNQP